MATAARNDYEGLLALVMHKQIPERNELPLSLRVAPEALQPSKPPVPTWIPSVLVIGGPLPPKDLEELLKRGCAVETVPDFVEGLRRMDEGRWEVVVVHPHVKEEADGLQFVRKFKHLRPEDLPDEFRTIFSRYQSTPFLILPVPETTQFAIFRTDTDWVLGDTKTISISDAILNARDIGHAADAQSVRAERQRDTDRAPRIFDPAVKREGFSRIMQGLLEAQGCRDRGDTQAAVEILLRVAREFAEKGKHLEAVGVLENALQIDPRNAEANALLKTLLQLVGH